MTRSQIIVDIVENNIKLSDALYRVILIAKELDNKDLIDWAKMEVNGYKNIENVPDYRKTVSTSFRYSGINGSFQIKSAMLDTSFLRDEILDKVKNVAIFEDINSVETKMNAENDTFEVDVTFLAPEIYANSNNGYTGIQCTSARQLIAKQLFSSIYNEVKTKLIDILTLVEKEIGNLDKIDLSKKVKSKKSKVNNEISQLFNFSEMAIETVPSKIFWKIIIPIATAILGGLAVLLIYELL